jgi:hypothetical protein
MEKPSALFIFSSVGKRDLLFEALKHFTIHGMFERTLQGADFFCLFQTFYVFTDVRAPSGGAARPVGLNLSLGRTYNPKNLFFRAHLPAPHAHAQRYLFLYHRQSS